MPGRWTAAAYTCLTVALTVAEPAVVSLTVHDHAQLDRLTGTSAERHGEPATGKCDGSETADERPRTDGT